MALFDIRCNTSHKSHLSYTWSHGSLDSYPRELWAQGRGTAIAVHNRTHIHTLRTIWKCQSAYVFGLGEETGVPGGKHGENMTTNSTHTGRRDPQLRRS